MSYKQVAIGELVDLSRGHNPPKSEFIHEPREGYVRFIQIRDAKNDKHAVYVPNSKKLRKAEVDDILLVAYRHVGNAFRGMSGAINVALCRLRNKDRDIILDDYLYYLIPTDYIKGELLRHSERSLIPSMSIKHLAEIKIPLPTLKVQKQIVAKLDHAFTDIEKAKENAEQNLKNSRELFESYLQNIFNPDGHGWAELTLKEASLDFGRGKSKHRPRNDESLYGGDCPFVQTGDVRNCEHLITRFTKTYNDKGLAQSKLWPKGTICITIAANIAETGILDFDSCFPDSVIGVVVNPKITVIRYVEYLLQSFKAILKAKGKGSAQDNINMGTFEKLKFPFPEIDKQNEMINSLDTLMTSVQELEVIYKNKILALDELKQSILQKAFNGELA